MARTTKTIWRVNTSDHNYSHSFSFLLIRRTAGEAEKEALKLARKPDAEHVRGEVPCRPYITRIEFVGERID